MEASEFIDTLISDPTRKQFSYEMVEALMTNYAKRAFVAGYESCLSKSHPEMSIGDDDYIVMEEYFKWRRQK